MSTIISSPWTSESMRGKTNKLIWDLANKVGAKETKSRLSGIAFPKAYWTPKKIQEQFDMSMKANGVITVF